MVPLNAMTMTVLLPVVSQCPAQSPKHNEYSANVDHSLSVRLQFKFSCLMVNVSRNLFGDRIKEYKEGVS